METIVNGSNGKIYKVIDRSGNNYILRDVKTKNYVIAHGFREPEKGWDQGKYFGNDKNSFNVAKETFMQYTASDSYGFN
jgi:hypothetical protein